MAEWPVLASDPKTPARQPALADVSSAEKRDQLLDLADGFETIDNSANGGPSLRIEAAGGKSLELLLDLRLREDGPVAGELDRPPQPGPVAECDLDRLQEALVLEERAIGLGVRDHLDPCQ